MVSHISESRDYDFAQYRLRAPIHCWDGQTCVTCLHLIERGRTPRIIPADVMSDITRYFVNHPDIRSQSK